MKKLSYLTVGLTLITGILILSGSTNATTPGKSDNGMLVEEWHYDMQYYCWGCFGSSPGIADLGADVNSVSGELYCHLEIVTGSDEVGVLYPDGSGWAQGLWYCFDSQGGLEWFTDTQSDESRGSVAIVDINNDGHLEIVGGTTSGETVEAMDRFGNFIWTFPDPPHAGNFMWPAAPAVFDVDPAINGLEVIIGNRPEGKVYALDGDNSDGVDDGYTWPGGWPWTGVEGFDWDILWVYDFHSSGDSLWWNEIYASTAIGDVDGDADEEAVVGATNGTFVVLDAKTGGLEISLNLGGIYASAALADLDGNGLLDIVIGSTNGNVYCIEWNGFIATTKWVYGTGGAVYSSVAIGDVNGDGALEVVVGSTDNNVYCVDSFGNMVWTRGTGGAVYSSPSLARRMGFGQYGNEWPMFRNNPARTGLYGGPTGTALGVYIGSEDDYFYLIDGSDGSVIDRFLVRPNLDYCSYRGVHTSAAIADVDGDMKLEFFFTDWGSESTKGGHTFWAVEDVESGEMLVSIDIKPQSCPNPLNIGKKGVLPVAILGTAEFDVMTVNPDMVMLEGVAPIRHNYEDVATPFDGCFCDCITDGADGFIDMTLKFDAQEIVAALGDVDDGEEIVLVLTGALVDNIPIEGSDCVVIRSKKKGRGKALTSVPESFVLFQNRPNPFNPETHISYAIPTDGMVALEIYNLLGHKVATLVHAYQAAGTYTVQWNAANVPTGVYFYRITVNDFTATKRMVLMK